MRERLNAVLEQRLPALREAARGSRRAVDAGTGPCRRCRLSLCCTSRGRAAPHGAGKELNSRLPDSVEFFNGVVDLKTHT